VGLRRSGGLLGLHGTGSGDRVHDVGLAVPAPYLPVRSPNLHHGHVVDAQVPGQGSTVGAGAFHPHRSHRPEPDQPRQQRPIPGRGRRERRGAQQPTDLIQSGSDMNIAVGVDAASDERACRCHRGHVRPSWSHSRAGTVRPTVGQDRDGPVTAGSY